MVQLLALKILAATVTAAAPTVAFLGLRYLHRRWRLTVADGQHRQAEELARQGVRFAQQRYKSTADRQAARQQKFATARAHVLQNAARRGLSLDEATLKALIEDEVFEFKRRSPEAVAATEPDDLTRIEGIGPKIAALLIQRGIGTYQALAGTDPDRLRALLRAAELYMADPATWPEQAALAAAGRWDELNALQLKLAGGRRAEAGDRQPQGDDQ